MSNSLWPPSLQHTRLSCPSLSPWMCSDSCSLSQWCHPTISFSECCYSLLRKLRIPQGTIFGLWMVKCKSPSHLFNCIVPNFFLNLFFNWRKIALQNFAVFCQTSRWISHRCTYVLSLEPPSHLPPHPTSLGWYRGPVWVSWDIIANSCWLSILYMVM